MEQINPDPLARQFIYDSLELNSQGCGDLTKMIEKLTELRAEDFTGFTVDVEEEEGQEAYPIAKVTRKRLETDEEYEARQQLAARHRKHRRQAYLRLKAEFEPTAEG
jgi:hypothetical protein